MGQVYYKKTVLYTIGVRYFRDDSKGKVLTNDDPVIAVDEDKLRDFKLANKAAILSGLIMETSEPSIEWETDNAITDEEMTNLTKSYLALKMRLQKIDSLPTLYRLLENAQTNDRTKKTLGLIHDRIDMLETTDDFSKDPTEMQGVDNG